MTTERTIFILGTPFCGSTLLGNALNAHPDMFFAGEIDRLSAFSRHPDPVTSCRICGSHHDRDCSFWSREFIKALDGIDTVHARYQAIRARSPKPVLIDGSKNVDWLNTLHDAGINRGVGAIVCARTPFAYVRSEMGATDVSPFVAATGWRDVYTHILRSLAGRGVPTIVIRYEDFAFNPPPAIEKICNFVGRPSDDSMLRYWEAPAHPLGGNDGAYLRFPNFQFDTTDARESWKPDYFAQKPFGGWIEDKWITELTEQDLRQIMSVPMISDVAGMLGYDLTWFLCERNRVLAEVRTTEETKRHRLAIEAAERAAFDRGRLQALDDIRLPMVSAPEAAADS